MGMIDEIKLVRAILSALVVSALLLLTLLTGSRESAQAQQGGSPGSDATSLRF